MVKKQIAEILNDERYFLYCTIKGIHVAEDESLIIIRDSHQESIKFNVIKQTYHYKFSIFALFPLKDQFFFAKCKKIERLLKAEGYQMEVCENGIQFRKG